MGKEIFEQEKISQAIEIGLGISRAGDIELVIDEASIRAFTRN